MIKSFIQLLFIVTILSACKKIQEKVIDVQGRVVNIGNGEPIDSAVVYIQDGVGNSSGFDFGPTSSGRKNSTVTNANGEFSISLKCEYNPYIYATKKNFVYKYIEQGAGTGAMPLSRGKKQNVVIELTGDTEFCGVFACQNNNCDSLKIQFLFYPDFQDGRPSCAGSGLNECRCSMCFDATKPFSYCDGNIVQGLIGERYFRFNLDIKRNGTWSTKTDSVFLKTAEVFKDTIYY